MTTSHLISYFSQMSLPARLATIHTVIIVASIALFPTYIFVPDPPFDDVYIIYLLVPGFHIYFVGLAISHQLFPLLLGVMSPYPASVICIVIVPGFVGILLGGLQWVVIGKIIEDVRRDRAWPR